MCWFKRPTLQLITTKEMSAASIYIRKMFFKLVIFLPAGRRNTAYFSTHLQIGYFFFTFQIYIVLPWNQIQKHICLIFPVFIIAKE